MGGPLTATVVVGALLGAPPFDPLIDQAREPPSGYALAAGLDGMGDTFGFWLEGRFPRFLQNRLAVSIAGGVGWFPSALPAESEAQSGDGPWSPFGQVRARIEMSLRMAETPHRIFVAVGPSAIFPTSERSSTDAGLGVHGGLGVELFGGDRFRTWPVALVLELGAAAHLARADANQGEAENAAPLATGIALSVGLRWYP